MRIQELEAKKQHWLSIMQIMDSQAGLDTAEGRAYMKLLVRMALIKREIDQIKKAVQ